jgi:broad specificity phosphatase PhoE
MRVVLVRHGETEWSRDGRHTGRTDVPLTDTGQRQAELLRPRLGAERFVLVLTSPLSRAFDTCRLAGLGDAAQVDPDLLEWDYGEYEGRTTTEIRAERPGWVMWRDGCPGGEGAGAVGARADRVIERCRTAGGDVALFSHGHVLRVVGARWTGARAEAGESLLLSTASASVLGYERGTPAIALWNDTSHLDPHL